MVKNERGLFCDDRVYFRGDPAPIADSMQRS